MPTPEILYPIPLTSGAAFDGRQYQSLEVQASSVTGTWTPSRTFDTEGASNFEACAGTSNNPGTLGDEVSSITTDGFYMFPGGAWFKVSDGSTGTFYIRGMD